MNPSPALAEFIEAVAADPELERALAGRSADDAFAAACAALAQERGWPAIRAEEVSGLLRERRLLWLQRHVL